jgi:hypothetical protein
LKFKTRNHAPPPPHRTPMVPKNIFVLMFYVGVWDHPSTVVPSKEPVSKTEHENKIQAQLQIMSVANLVKLLWRNGVEIKVNTVV